MSHNQYLSASHTVIQDGELVAMRAAIHALETVTLEAVATLKALGRLEAARAAAASTPDTTDA